MLKSLCSTTIQQVTKIFILLFFVAPLQQTCVIVQTFARRRRNLFREGKNLCLKPWGHFSGNADHKQ